MDNWCFVFKSYHQVNLLSVNRFEARARKSIANSVAGETRVEKSVCSPQAKESVMWLEHATEFLKNLLMSHVKQLYFGNLIY